MSAKPEEIAAAHTDAAAAPVENKLETEKEPEIAPKAEDKDSSAVPTEALSNLSVSEKKPDDGIPAAAPILADDRATNPANPNDPVWPETPQDHPLTKFFTLLPSILDEAGHADVYGVTLSPTSPFTSKLILQKFLRANQGDLEKAKQQLLETLKWRKEFDPVKAAGETFEKSRFDGLGYVLEVEGVPDSTSVTGKDVVTFNIYGAVKDNKLTFGDLEG
jgi:hypothetical protein